MAMPVTVGHRWTVEEVLALPAEPGKRHEVVDGELLVSPSPRTSHQVAVTELAGELRSFLRGMRIGAAIVAPSDVILDARTLVQPDVYVMPFVNGRLPHDDDVAPTPLLVIEVLSPSTARHDRFVKRPRYQREGIECWLVDLDSRMFERWTPDADRPELLTESITWQPHGTPALLRLDLGAFFLEVLGEA